MTPFQRSERNFGFNVIGNITASTGLGVAARNLLDLILGLGHPVCAFDMKAGHGRDGKDLTHATLLRQTLLELPYSINIFVFPISGLQLALPGLKTQFEYQSYFNTTLCYWELPSIPPRWLGALESLDAIVATSDYMAHTYRCAVSDTAVVPALLPVHLPEERPVPRFRRELGIPGDAVVFVTTFEPASDPGRKNPLATIDAFISALGHETNAHLILRVNNPAMDGVEHPFLRVLRERVEGHPRIRLFADSLSYPEVIGLYAECDVFVSLHRAEGLGLAMAEAMLLGKPVIATAWSGNLTFMDRRSACLVGYRLVPVTETSAYDPSELDDTTAWADPNEDEAATWMKLLHGDVETRRQFGLAGRTRMLAHNREAAEGKFLNELQSLLVHRKRFPRTAVTPGAGNEMQRIRRSRLAQYQELERELRWIKDQKAYRLGVALKRLLKGPLVRVFASARHRS